jgi:hypothetical protein
MKKYLMILSITVMLFIIACGKQPDPQFFQGNFSQPAPKTIALKCMIGSIYYYQDSFFIYHVNDIGDRVVYSPVGSYTMPENYSRWQYRSFLNLNDSLYNQTLGYINKRGLPNGQLIGCNETTEIPVDFKKFVKDHEPIFRQNLFNKSNVISM